MISRAGPGLRGCYFQVHQMIVLQASRVHEKSWTRAFPRVPLLAGVRWVCKELRWAETEGSWAISCWSSSVIAYSCVIIRVWVVHEVVPFPSFPPLEGCTRWVAHSWLRAILLFMEPSTKGLWQTQYSWGIDWGTHGGSEEGKSTHYWLTQSGANCFQSFSPASW